MAFDITKLRMISPASLFPPTTPVDGDPAAVWAYGGSDNSTEIAATGYFAGIGAGGRASTGVLGARVGDLLVNIESSAGASPGLVTWHSFVASTKNTTDAGAINYGYDLTVSTAP